MTLASAPAAEPQHLLPRLWKVDPRYLITFLITLVLVVGEYRYAILGGYKRLATTLGICVVAELLLSR
ncbi:MAG: hypothetical protein ACR2G6_03555, partial [Gemmatimonadaceae bacterium]